MQRRVARAYIVDVVGGDDGQAQLAGQQVELLHVAGGAGQLLVDQLDEEVVAAEEPGVGGRRGPGAGLVAGGKRAPTSPRRQADRAMR